jgi:hypothetical protein
MRPGSFAIKAVLAFALLITANSASAQEIGYVLDISGDWTLNNDTALTNSSPVTANGVIATKSPSDRANYIVIANRSGKIIARKACRNSGECNNPIRLPSPTQPSVAGELFKDIMGWWWRSEPKKYAAAESKGTNLNEAVAKLQNNQLDLSSVFLLMDADDYVLKLEPLFQVDKPTREKSGRPISYQWDPKKPKPLVGVELTPGLYRLSLLSNENEVWEETGTDAWVLISNQARYEELQASFKQAVDLTKDWGKRVKPNTARSFLRAELDRLSK